MSIQAEIASRVAEGRLIQLKPGVPEHLHVRQIYFGAEIQKWMRGNHSGTREAIWVARARALLEGFVLGDRIPVRMPPSKRADTVVAMLEPAEKNVWTFRVRDPRPGARILGRFAAVDVFVATHWVRRESLIDTQSKENEERKWRDELVRCKTIWAHLFPAYDPITGSTPNDFISNSFHV